MYISLVPRLFQILCFHSNRASSNLLWQVLRLCRIMRNAIYHSFVLSQQLSLSNLANLHLREPGNKATCTCSMCVCLLVVVTSLFCSVKVVSELFVKCTCTVAVLVLVLYHVRGSSSKNYALNSVLNWCRQYHRMHGMFTHFHVVSYYYPVYGYTTVLYISVYLHVHQCVYSWVTHHYVHENVYSGTSLI